MKKSILYFVIVPILFALSEAGAESGNPRLVILADMGNEPDEEQQMVHLMLYANEFDIEGLIAVTGIFLRPSSPNPYKQVLHPELFMGIIDGYRLVVENLRLHAGGWPTPDYLRSVVASGQTGYGIEAIGEGKSSQGSELLIRSFLKEDTRPLHIIVNAGSNTLAQALTDFETRFGRERLDAVIAKLRVFENGAQDNAGAWLCTRYPALHWIRSNHQTYCYGGPGFDSTRGWEDDDKVLGPYAWEPYEYSGRGQHQWLLEHKGNHLGKYYPLRHHRHGRLTYIEGGGTIPWLGLIHGGLADRMHPAWGGWSGRFTREKARNVWSRHPSVKESELKYEAFSLFTEVADTWTDPESGVAHENTYAPVWRWRRAMFNSFKARMQWCSADYQNANHYPVAAINGDTAERIHFLRTTPGAHVVLDASASHDPDGNVIRFNWWVYREAGTYPGMVTVEDAEQSLASCVIPPDASGQTIHVILEVKDEHPFASLYDYRRIVISVD